MKIFAYPYDEKPGFPFEATHWYWQIDNHWVAVVSEFEHLPDWLAQIDELIGPFNLSPPPDDHVYPISETPPYGTLMFRDEHGEAHIREVNE